MGDLKRDSKVTRFEAPVCHPTLPLAPLAVRANTKLPTLDRQGICLYFIKLILILYGSESVKNMAFPSVCV